MRSADASATRGLPVVATHTMNALATEFPVHGVRQPSEKNARARRAGEELYAAGAIAILAGEPRPILIGDLQWLNERELLIFTAYGDAPTDAHLLRFDQAIVHETGSVTFLCDGDVTGAIQHIDHADVDDPDDYRIAWQLWQDVAPLHWPLIERCYAAVQSHARL